MNSLLAYFTDIKNQVTDVAAQKGMVAGGKTGSTLQIAETATGYDLLADGGVYFMDNEPVTTIVAAANGNPNLPQIIADWLDVRGLDPTTSRSPKAIDNKAARLYRSRTNTTLGVPLNPDRLDVIFNQVSAEQLQEVTQQIFETFDFM